MAVVLLLAGAQPAGAATTEHVYARGDAVFHGSTGDTPLASNVTGMARTPSGGGYRLTTGTGRVFVFGDAGFYGDLSWTPYSPIVDMAATPSGNGYWLVAADGGIYSWGEAPYYGSMGGQPLGGPIVAIEAAVDGNGYWLTGADGAVYSFGAAGFHGSMQGAPLNHPVVDMEATAGGDGYWLLARDGGVFTFGAGQFYGSPGGTGITAAAFGATADDQGYWVAATNGTISNYGNAAAFDAVTGARPLTAMAVTPSGAGLWLASEGAGPGGVAGSVIDDTGAPAPEVCVGVYAGAPNWRSFQGRTDASGSYAITDVPAGDYTVYVNDCDGADYLYTSVPSITVRSGETTRLDVTVQRAAKVSGVVTDEAGAPVSNICVMAWDRTTSYGYGGRTTETGSYRLAGMEPSDYAVEFAPCYDAENWETEWWDDKPSRDAADPLVLAVGEHRTDIDAVVGRGASISGVVAPPGEYFACVKAYDPTGDTVAYAYTSVTGHYRLTGLRADDYKVQFGQCDQQATLAPEWWDDQPTMATADVVTTTRGGAVEGIDANLVPGGKVTGTVIDAAGRPAAGTCVEARDVDGTYATWATTQDDGNYTVTGLGNSSYLVRAFDCGNGIYGEEWYNEAASAAEADPVAVTAGGVVSGIDFTVTGAAGTLLGTVVDSTGVPLRDVCAMADDANGNRWYAWTDADGNYRFRPMPSGSYKLMFSDCGQYGYQTEYYDEQTSLAAATPVEVVAGQDTVVDEDFGTVRAPNAPSYVATYAGDSTVYVSWPATWGNGGRPVTGYTVTVHPTGTTITTSETGVTVDGLTNGETYWFTVRATNAVGDSSETSSGLATPFAAPGAPTDVVAEPWYESAKVSWTAPADGGSPISHYVITGSDGTEVVASESPVLVGSLTNGETYTFTVKAMNQYGYGPESAPSNPVTPATDPGPPENVTATAGDGAATVNWTPPAWDGGSPVTSYTVYNGVTYEATTTTGTSLTVPGLTNGRSYYFVVTARNAVGESWGAESNSVTPAGPPPAPTNVSATAGNGSATVSWSASAANGSALTGYTVTASNGATATTTGTSLVFGGLTNGTSYTFTVRATNGVGDSAESAPSDPVTPAALPSVPTDVTATAGDGSATVSWSASAANGSALTGYTVTASNGATGTTTGTSLVFEGLANGTSYTFTVRATNGVGNSAESAPSNSVTPAGLPAVPTGVSATAGDQSATVSWTASADNGSAITGYTVTASNGATATTSGTSLVFGSLTNGTSYTFTVRATNGVGDSAESAPSNAVTPSGVPDAPSGVSATPGDSSATVSWTAPADNGNPITGYTVTASTGATATTAGTSLVFGNLTNGTSYTFTVRATSSVGDSAESAPSNAVTPAGTPTAPTEVTAVAGDGSATVSWTASAANGSAITGYTVTASSGASATTADTSVVFGGLANGTSYTFTVRATNGVGDSAESAPSNAVTPAGLPAAPTGVTATAGNQSATVSWTASVDNGSVVSGYTVTASNGATATTDGTSLVFSGLTNGTSYTFTVRATNGIGDSAESAPSNAVTPATTPDAPTNVSATAGNMSARVSWTAPASDGGSPVTLYTVTSSGGTTATTTSTSVVVTGLTNLTSYTFTVRATNAMGDSAESAPSNAVIPLPVPGSPLSVRAEGGDGSALVTWTAPASDGGTPILNYTVTVVGTSTNVTVPGSARSATVPGLTNGQRYTFTATATNAVGTSPPSDESNSVKARRIGGRAA
ncbi:MAG TPA: fibronectin type III domain-containing protein [Acidimicrobiales bacterium]|nr:fibronectin type III domain-containing protein [Acidimicrobiales bacterium]